MVRYCVYSSATCLLWSGRYVRESRVMVTNHPGCVLHNCNRRLFALRSGQMVTPGVVQCATYLTVPDGYDRLCFQRWPPKSLSSHGLFCSVISSCPHQQEEPVSSSLDPGWPSEFFWVIECGKTNAGWLRRSGMKRSIVSGFALWNVPS